MRDTCSLPVGMNSLGGGPHAKCAGEKRLSAVAEARRCAVHSAMEPLVRFL